MTCPKCNKKSDQIRTLKRIRGKVLNIGISSFGIIILAWIFATMCFIKRPETYEEWLRDYPLNHWSMIMPLVGIVIALVAIIMAYATIFVEIYMLKKHPELAEIFEKAKGESK
jgi:hypothetical protein